MGKQKSLLPSFEVLFIIVFFVCFLLLMVPKCMRTKATRQNAKNNTENTIDSLDKMMDSLTIKPNTVSITTDSTSKANHTALSTAKNTIADTKLYITIDKLKLRTGPSLDSAIIITLPLFEQVFFTGEVTEFTQKISLGYEIADEPWVKIRTLKGRDGWVYGAGVHYYKMKRHGVME